MTGYVFKKRMFRLEFVHTYILLSNKGSYFIFHTSKHEYCMFLLKLKNEYEIGYFVIFFLERSYL
ncbi:hypothetical protein bcgnr5369_01750 [Bacillus cereus]